MRYNSRDAEIRILIKEIRKDLRLWVRDPSAEGPAVRRVERLEALLFDIEAINEEARKKPIRKLRIPK